MTIRRSAKQVAAMLNKAYLELCSLEVAAGRLADLRDRLGFLASVYCEWPIGPDEQKIPRADIDPAEDKRAGDNEKYSFDLATAIDDILTEQYPAEILAALPEPFGTHTLPNVKTTPPTVADIIRRGETPRAEFKSTLRVNLHTGQNDERLEHSCLKTIAAFLNTEGGHLIIGVNDAREVIGIEADRFRSEDKMHLHLKNLICTRLGPTHMLHVKAHFETVDGKQVLLVQCEKSQDPVFLREANTEQFFIRTGPSTTELLPSQTQNYIKRRFYSPSPP